MSYDELKSLIDHLNDSSVSFIDYKNQDEHIILSKELPHFASPVVEPPSQPSPVAQEDVAAPLTGPPADENQQESESTIDSPMVGVAYLQAKPGEAPYVQVGDHVAEGQVVMIVEAMKLMNEIQADKSGVVAEILVDNEEVVEFGQPLIRLT